MTIRIEFENQSGIRKVGPFDFVQLDGMYLEDEANGEIAHYSGDWMTPDGTSWEICVIYAEGELESDVDPDEPIPFRVTEPIDAHPADHTAGQPEEW